jgi:hypothetical protein
MAGPGVNLAITKDGGTYNKLQRPDNYLTSTTPLPPPKKQPLADHIPSTGAIKRKHEHADPASKYKRTRVGQDRSHGDTSDTWAAGKERLRGVENGMRTMLPGLDDEQHSVDGDIDEALAYLRDVR